jgi:hypothetical protein
VDDTPTMLVKGVRFESQTTLAYEKARCELQIDLDNLGPGKVTDLRLHVRVVELGNRNRLLAEEYYQLEDLQEGVSRTDKLSLKSLIKKNCILQMELYGNEIEPQYNELKREYSRTRR